MGCGDVLQRALPWLVRRFRIYALARSDASAQALRAQGVIPVRADLDNAASLKRLAGLADYLLHSAPPPTQGRQDPRLRRLLAALLHSRILPRGAVYISTTGVYGDCGGEPIDETRPCRPGSERAWRRVDAESQLRRYGRLHGRVSMLRAPGIYAADRLPIERVRAGTPAVAHGEDSYSNHIHADDLAHAACLALFRGKPQRCVNVCDDSEWKMGEWFDRVAAAYGLLPVPRLARADIQAAVSPALWSFMRESRRIRNDRLKRELRMRLSYATPQVLLDRMSLNEAA